MKLRLSTCILLFVLISIVVGCNSSSTSTDPNSEPEPKNEKTEFNTILNKTFGGSEGDEGYSVIQTSDNGYVIAGYSSSNDGDLEGLNKGENDILVLKLNSRGEKEWIKDFGGSSYELATSIIQTEDGGYALTGQKQSTDGDFSGISNNGHYDIFVMKLNAAGEKQWVKSFGGNEGEIGNSIIQSRNGDLVIAGESQSTDGDFDGLDKEGNDIVLIRLASNGEKRWLKTIGGSSGEYATSIVQTSDNGFMITGSSFSDDGDFNGIKSIGYDILAIKLDTNGNLEWIKSFGGRERDRGRSIIQSSDGGFAITGDSESTNGDFNDVDFISGTFILKLDSEGEKQWLTSFRGSKGSVGYSIIETADNGFAITGYTQSNDGDFEGLIDGMSDAILIKVNNNGEKEWITSFGGSSMDDGNSLIQTTDGNFTVTGERENENSWDLYILTSEVL